jgi:hypothetical protein
MQKMSKVLLDLAERLLAKPARALPPACSLRMLAGIGPWTPSAATSLATIAKGWSP